MKVLLFYEVMVIIVFSNVRFSRAEKLSTQRLLSAFFKIMTFDFITCVSIW